MKRIAVLTALLLLAVPARSQVSHKTPERRPPDPPHEEVQKPGSTLGLAGRIFVGERAPDFLLESAFGKEVKLSSLRGDWIVLAFADRATEVVSLRNLEERLRPLGARLVAVCREKPQTLRARAANDSLTFLLLADPTGQVADAYGLYDRLYSRTRPGFVVLDRRGVMRFAVLGQLLPADEVQRLTEFAITGS